MAQALIGLGRQDEARVAADRGLALCREHGMYFLGASLLATVARLEDDPRVRGALIAEGAAAVARGGLSFNLFWYYENAIEEALGAGTPAAARALADALERAAVEPLGWVSAVAMRARALADALEPAPPTELRASIGSALEAVRARGMGSAALDLQDALARLG